MRKTFGPNPAASGLTNLFIDEISQGRVAHQQPPARRDAVRLVLELLGPELVEALEQVGLDQLGVDPGDAVDGLRSNNGLGWKLLVKSFTQ